jgi:hypothetical protein
MELTTSRVIVGNWSRNLLEWVIALRVVDCDFTIMNLVGYILHKAIIDLLGSPSDGHGKVVPYIIGEWGLENHILWNLGLPSCKAKGLGVLDIRIDRLAERLSGLEGELRSRVVVGLMPSRLY